MPLPPGPAGPPVLQTLRWLRDPVGVLDRSRVRFGETFTIRLHGVEPIVFSGDLKLIQALYSVDRANGVSPGREETLKPVMGERSIFFARGERHLELRRLMSPPLQGGALEECRRIAGRRTAEEVERWERGRRFGLMDRLQCLVLGVLVEVLFGATGRERRAELEAAFWELRELNGSALRRRWEGLRVRLRRGSRIAAVGRRLGELIAAEVAQRRAAGTLEAGTDLLSRYALTRRSDGRPFSDRELRDQVVSVMMAGHDATAIGIAWTLEQLARHPEVDRRAARAGAGEEPGYLSAVIRESLRIRPVAPSAGRRLGKDLRHGEWELPAGTLVAASMYLAHTSERNFPQPLRFDPDRFLRERTNQAWIPFGGGVRRCLGASLAEALIEAVLTELLPRVSVSLASGRDPGPRPLGVLWAPARGMPAIGQARGRPD